MKLKFSDEVQKALDKISQEDQHDYIEDAVWNALYKDGYFQDEATITSSEKLKESWAIAIKIARD